MTERIVDTAPNCGNILCAVGAYAIEKGLMPITGDETTIRIRNINTNTFVNATVQTPNGHIVYEGDTTIASVPGHAAPIALTFLNACGTKLENYSPRAMPLILSMASKSVVSIWRCQLCSLMPLN